MHAADNPPEEYQEYEYVLVDSPRRQTKSPHIDQQAGNHPPDQSSQALVNLTGSQFQECVQTNDSRDTSSEETLTERNSLYVEELTSDSDSDAQLPDQLQVLPDIYPELHETVAQTTSEVFHDLNVGTEDSHLKDKWINM